MVECEYDLSRKNRKYVRVLIDRWWNVNEREEFIFEKNKWF